MMLLRIISTAATQKYSVLHVKYGFLLRYVVHAKVVGYLTLLESVNNVLEIGILVLKINTKYN